MSIKKCIWLASFLLAPIFLAGCAEVIQVGTTVGQVTGQISPEDKQKIDRLAVQTESAARPMTEREEYYLGRAVAATILGQYRLYQNQPLTFYINEIGQAVGLGSDRPYIYGNYHFAILDTEEVNALSCPGGLIFITRGILKKAGNEEEVAAILAHEVGHVNHQDGVKAIQSARWTEVATLIGSEAVQRLSGADLAKLVSLFEGSVNDVVKTLLLNGYSREQEASADLSALTFLNRLGYDSGGLVDFLGKLAKDQTSGSGKGIFTTHPGMAERLAKARLAIQEKQWPPIDHRIRDQRFIKMTG